MENLDCPNCSAKMSGNYCSNCGQKTKLTPIQYKDLAKEFLSAFANYDAPFPKTVISLFIKPGPMVREYLGGKRKTYFAAVRYAIICLAISLVVVELTNYDPVLMEANKSGTHVESNKYLQAGEYVHKNINYFIFLFPFFVTVVSKLFFWKSGYRSAERTALGFFITGQYLIINSIMIPFILVEPLFGVVNRIIFVLYIAFFYYSFFKPKRKLVGIFKSFIASIFSWAFYSLISIYIAAFILNYSKILDLIYDK